MMNYLGLVDKKLITHFLIGTFFLTGYSQTPKIDSLKRAANVDGITREAKIKTMLDLAFRLSMEDLAVQSVEVLNQTEALLQPEDSLPFYPAIYQEYTRSYYLLGQFSEALDYARVLEAFADVEREKILQGVKVDTQQPIKRFNTSDAYTIIGEIYRKMGYYDKALEYALTSMELSELLEKPYHVANAYNNIGIIYAKMDDLEESNVYYRKALQMNQELGRDTYAGSNYHNLGINYKNTGQWDSAFFCYKEAAKYITSPYGVATINTSVAMVFYEIGNYDSARYHLQQALAIQRQHNYQEQMSYSLVRLAQLFNQTGDFKKALELGKQSYDINQDQNSYDLLHQSAYELSIAYENLNDPINSLRYFKIHKQFHDSVYSKSRIQELTTQQVRFSTREKENENALLRKQTALDKAKIRQQLVIGVFLVLVLMLSICLYVLAKRRTKVIQELGRQKLENEKNVRRLSACDDAETGARAWRSGDRTKHYWSR
ncbi:MAG: tetratricopeptide repeat protein [Bacteroidota bacterium]